MKAEKKKKEFRIIQDNFFLNLKFYQNYGIIIGYEIHNGQRHESNYKTVDSSVVCLDQPQNQSLGNFYYIHLKFKFYKYSIMGQSINNSEKVAQFGI